MSFDLLAPHYRWMEALLAGELLQHCRTRWMSEIAPPRRALLVGEGPGRMLEACVKTWPGCAFTVIDSSSRMIEQARKRWRQQNDKAAVEFIEADLRTWPAPTGAYDLVVTNFFLDCFAPVELEWVINKLGAASAPSSAWLVSDFQVPRDGWRRIRAQIVLALAYGFFRMATDITAHRISSPDDGLQSAGFALQRREYFNFGLLHADLWRRVAPIKNRDSAASIRQARHSHRDANATMA